MKPLFKTTADPLVILVREADGTVKETESRVCAHCRIVHHDEKSARDCCRQPYCQRCGTEVQRHFSLCRHCIKDRRIQSATEVTDYDGPVYDEASDVYYADLGAMFDALEDEDLPEYVYACTVTRVARENPNRLVDWLCERVLDGHHEDAELDHLDELTEAIAAWLTKQTTESWEPDYKRKVRLRAEND